MSNCLVSNKKVTIESFQLCSGVASGDIEIDCCLWGDLDKPLVVLLGGISADRWALDQGEVNTPGWWHKVFNSVSYINTKEFSFLTFEYFSYPEKVTNPPVITTTDQAYILRQIQNKLVLPQFYTVIGASYGGMVAMAFAQRFPLALVRLVCIAAGDRNTVKSQALRQIQRRIIHLGAQQNIDSERQKQFISLARSLAMVGYRGEQEWEQRFQSPEAGIALKSVSAYLQYHGECFADRFSASRYCQLSKSIDYHQVDVSQIQADTLIIGISSDQMVPVEDIQSLPCKFQVSCNSVIIDSDYGHDGFLLEANQLNQLFKTFFSEQTHDYIEPNSRSASGH
ncbi:MAG: homoserine O-acetyltransferase [marine bacterium B5-7]|nr:MAG: homoserine O-acetyltransferase [marine bacterium B5-7]